MSAALTLTAEQAAFRRRHEQRDREAMRRRIGALIMAPHLTPEQSTELAELADRWRNER